MLKNRIACVIDQLLNTETPCNEETIAEQLTRDLESVRVDPLPPLKAGNVNPRNVSLENRSVSIARAENSLHSSADVNDRDEVFESGYQPPRDEFRRAVVEPDAVRSITSTGPPLLRTPSAYVARLEAL